MGWQNPLECKPCYLLQRAGQEALTNAEWKAFCGCWTSFMLSSASRVCKDLSTVQRICCFLSPFSIFFMLRQLAGWPCTARVFIQTDPGLSLTKCSLHFSSCCLFFDFSCLSLSLKRDISSPFPLPYFGPIPQQDAWLLLLYWESMDQFPLSDILQRSPFIEASWDPTGTVCWVRQSFAHVFTSLWLLGSQKLSATHVCCIKEL